MLNKLISIIVIIINIVAYWICGLLICVYEGFYDVPSEMRIAFYVVGLVLFYVVLFLNVIIHEAGHLVFGLLSGYKFSSFRILKFTIVKVDGKFKVKKYNIPGSMGQCLMAPPELKNGKMPVVLFNYGGVIFNVLSAVICHYVFGAISFVSYADLFLLMMIITGLNLAITNGIPSKNRMLANDGYNTFSMLKNENAMLSMWTQLKINACLTEGVRIKDMPAEWFYLPDDESMQNKSEAVMGVFYCSRVMDEGKFEEAGTLIEHLLNIKSGIIGLHRIQLTLDLMFCEMICKNRKDVIEKLYTKQIAKSMKAMGCFLSTIRTEYAYALLFENDKEKAEAVFKRFENTANKYPYKSDVEAEYELIGLIDRKYTQNREDINRE